VQIRTIAAISLAYDGMVGVLLLAGRPLLVQLFQVPPPQPPIHADLNGLFLLAVALGYLIPFLDPGTPAARRYLWIMGPFLKGLGAATFLLDYVVRHSPASFLVFAASDGIVGALTLWVLLRTSRSARA
jgi:hypothetical protein